MTISGSEHIYQTNLFDFELERLDFSSFIDSKVFSVIAKDIKRLSIYQRNNSSPTNVLEFKRNNWLSKKYHPPKFNNISNKNTENKVNEIFNIKTHKIIDRSDAELGKIVSNYLASPTNRIVVKTKSGETIKYKVSKLVKTGAKLLKIEKIVTEKDLNEYIKVLIEIEKEYTN